MNGNDQSNKTDQTTSSSSIEFFLTISFNLSFFGLTYSQIGYDITIKVAKRADNVGIRIMVYLMNYLFDVVSSWASFEYAQVAPIQKITAPALNLSNKLQTPKTKAPVLALVPITSEMKFMPVDKIIVCENPMKTAKIYTTHPTLGVKNKKLPIDPMQITVPTPSAAFLPNFKQNQFILELAITDEKQTMRGTSATVKGTEVSVSSASPKLRTPTKQNGKRVPNIFVHNLTPMQQTPKRQNLGILNQSKIDQTFVKRLLIATPSVSESSENSTFEFLPICVFFSYLICCFSFSAFYLQDSDRGTSLM